ncbi:hypothetical protein GCM10027445_32070 [Amycolatopsis endophytica]|uniref:Crotonobetainyl-CoA:carnitine CoA-transferase CaiB-like acyl-CoA transferase n=1 Tax=Amycolatopsis endophytica TaxID=860233 RepID=A0A853B235_9PSEU|nr:hypothetical protein [Amycolatopsis endophytica]NYI88831.1 crotonobetainyl-CoA:carnitine CoA-transferase CaiB-like acyl-CoA transferase [Amycolatopsis endophytica]
MATLPDPVDDPPLTTHPVAGAYRAIPGMTRFGRPPVAIRRHAPLIGEHTREAVEEAEARTAES